MRKIQFYIDSETSLPHIYKHKVTEEEVEDVLSRPSEDRLGREGTRVTIGQTQAGRCLRVIYVPEAESGNIFIITAHDLRGKALLAYRRRRRRRKR